MTHSPPMVALASLVVPGLGQLLLGRRTRALALFVVALIVVALLTLLEFEPWLWLTLIPFWLYNVWDAYTLAGGQRPNTALLALLGALPVYALGWQVTDIDVSRLVANAPKVRPLVAGLFQPEFLGKEREIASASQQIYLPCPAPAPVVGEAAPQGGQIALSAECAAVGDTISLSGSGFPAGQRVGLWWVNPVNAERRVQIFDAYEDFAVGEDGRFEGEIVVPQALPARADQTADIHRVEVRYIASEGGYFITNTTRLVFQRMGETIAQALMATLVGALLAMPFSFFGARNLMAGNPVLAVLYYISRAVMNVLRSVEPLIMAIVFVVWVGLGPFAGVLALIVHTIAALGKLYSESIESIDAGPIEAIRATGANPLQVIAFGVVPQVVPPWIAFTVYRWDINVRMSTIIGFVGGGGIGFLLAQWIRLSDFQAAGAAIWAIAVVVVLLDYLSARVRERVL